MAGDEDVGDSRRPMLANVLHKFGNSVDKPVTWFRESVLEPMRGKNKQYYYHRRFRRVPTVDECYEDDFPCIYEASEQLKRDKMVDGAILNILRQRKMECMFYYGADLDKKCVKVTEDYELAAANHFAKYGDMGAKVRVVNTLMKQKHQMLWERRHKKSLVTGEPLEG